MFTTSRSFRLLNRSTVLKQQAQVVSHCFFSGSAKSQAIELPTQCDISSATDGYFVKHGPNTNILKIPAFGFGTWGCEHFNHDVMAQAVKDAIEVGFRHIDCARVYANEELIGEVFQDVFENGTVKREDLFITSKLFNTEHAPPNKIALEAASDSARQLKCDYLDLFLVHWPFRFTADRQPLPYDAESWSLTYKLMYDSLLQGHCRSIGVSNASRKKIGDMMKFCEQWNLPIPQVNQIELHPYLQQPETVKFCNDLGILVQATMPLGSPERPKRFFRDEDPVVLDHPVVREIADEIGASPAQVIIRWHLQRGIIVFPKATERWMIQENFDALHLKLSDEQMMRINACDEHYRFARAEVSMWDDSLTWEDMFDHE